MKTLLLRFIGPMQSWGIDSRFVMRETGLEPSKSGVIGLLCAALGKPQKDEEAEHHDYPPLSRLAGLRLGVRVDRPGVMQSDYHTAGGAHLPEETMQGSWGLYGVLKASAEPRRFDEPPRKGDLKTELSPSLLPRGCGFPRRAASNERGRRILAGENSGTAEETTLANLSRTQILCALRASLVSR